MKCLSLWQPWASVIFEKDENGVQLKPDETRGWHTRIRGTIAIHAAKKVIDRTMLRRYQLTLDALGLTFGQLPFGAIIGTVEIVNCRPADVVAPEREPWQVFWGDYRTIGDDGKRRYAFELRNPIRLTHPIPCIGRQGFFEVDL